MRMQCSRKGLIINSYLDPRFRGDDNGRGEWMRYILLGLMFLCCYGCTVKAVGDPNRPITIEAHVTIDIKGLKDTATDIEDYVSKNKNDLPVKGGK